MPILRRRILVLLPILYQSDSVHGHPVDKQQTQQPVTELEALQITGRASDLFSVSSSASQGVIGQPEFEFRPILRSGELVEIIPGMMATQHSGTGKANQYYLRGFNLDHGTDFSATADNIPMNMPSHGHGQGYLDLNSIIPELIDVVEYGKGPYHTEIGDFSSAGYAHFHTVHSLPQGFVKFGYGEHDYYRGVAANSHQIGDGDLLYGAEVNFYQGPWRVDEHLRKYNGILKYTQGDYDNGFSIIGNAYYSNWDSTDQIPQRAVDDGRISRLDTVDPSNGGDTSRHSLSANWWDNDNESKSELSVFAVYYDFHLWSNFTYFLNDQENGDQIKQVDRRYIFGGKGEHTWYNDFADINTATTLGLQVRHDTIPRVGLFNSTEREITSTTRDNRINQTNVSIYGELDVQWLEKLRTVFGVRSDFYVYDVEDRLDGNNSGETDAAIVSPKLGIILGPWFDTEYYINGGYGYHSNDARGATAATDPVDPLVSSRGAEVGLRNTLIPGLTTTLALWYLELGSELVFVGDKGTTEPFPASERYGIEWTNYYLATDWLTLDADFAFSHSEFKNVQTNEKEIPNSLGTVITAGATIDLPNGIFGSIRMRHFDDVPLNESGSIEAGATTLVNLGLGYRYKNLRIEGNIYNLFNRTDSDISYFYESQLQGEQLPQEDIHFHPVEPRTFRIQATYDF